MRNGVIKRTTNETEITAELCLDGRGCSEIDCGCAFFKHMLEQFVCHSGFDLKLSAKSKDGDNHHLIEDTAIALGCAFKEALADKSGINRYGQCILPMDEALVLCAVDISGRAFSTTELDIKCERVSDFETILVPHFFYSFAQNAAVSIHIKQLSGTDSHHIIEAAFKSFARAISQAAQKNDTGKIPSTKGCL